MCREVAVSELAVRVTDVASIRRRVCSPAVRLALSGAEAPGADPTGDRRSRALRFFVSEPGLSGTERPIFRFPVQLPEKPEWAARLIQYKASLPAAMPASAVQQKQPRQEQQGSEQQGSEQQRQREPTSKQAAEKL